VDTKDGADVGADVDTDVGVGAEGGAEAHMVARSAAVEGQPSAIETSETLEGLESHMMNILWAGAVPCIASVEFPNAHSTSYCHGPPCIVSV